MYQASSRPGWRHKIEADMPERRCRPPDAPRRPGLAHHPVGRQIQPVNFHEPGDDTSRPALPVLGLLAPGPGRAIPLPPRLKGRHHGRPVNLFRATGRD